MKHRPNACYMCGWSPKDGSKLSTIGILKICNSCIDRKNTPDLKPMTPEQEKLEDELFGKMELDEDFEDE